MDQTNTAQDNNREGTITDRDRYHQMCELDVEEKVEEFPYAGVNKNHLELISCIQLENLDVDIDAHRDGASTATFFEPSSPISDDVKNMFSPHWSKLRGGQAPRLYPEYMAGWFMYPWGEVEEWESDELEIDRFGGTAWQCLWYV